MNWKEKMRKDGLENGFGMIAYETEPLIQFIEDLLKHSQQQLLESLEEDLENGFEEYMVKKSDVKALIQSKKELL